MSTKTTNLNKIVKLYRKLYDEAAERAEQNNFCWGYATALSEVIEDLEIIKTNEEEI